MKLWKHEITRAIADRFINDNDKEWFNAEVMSLVKTHLGPDCQQTIVDKQYFVDFLRDAHEPTGEEEGDTDMELGDLSEDEGDLTPGDVVEEDGREAEHDGEN